MVQAVEEWLAREVYRFSERCVHENHSGCSLGIDWVELSGTKDRPHWKRPPNWCFRPCLGAMKTGDASCERYEKPTELAVRERGIDIELQRIKSAEEWAADQAAKEDGERQESQRINQSLRTGERR